MPNPKEKEGENQLSLDEFEEDIDFDEEEEYVSDGYYDIVAESNARKKKNGKKIIIDLGKGPEENLVIEEEERYSPYELDLMAEEILRAHARSIDVETGKPTGIKGDNPVLFEEHIQARKRREIYNQNGTPDPSINEGMFWRTHPQGRKVNNDEQRKKHGASFYR